MSALDDIKPVEFEWADESMGYGIIAQEVSTFPGFGAVPPAMPIGSITISNGGAVGANTVASSYYTNGVISGSGISTMQPSSLTIATDPSILNTNKHSINIDEFYEDLIAIKQIMIEMAKDEDLMERNAVIRDILSTWLIKGLSK